MTERHLPVQRQQALRLHSCRQEEEATRVEWEPREPPAETLFDARGQRQRRRQVEAARELGGSQPARELQQCKGIAPGLGNDALENGCVQPSREGRLQERPCIPTAQRIDGKLRKAEQAITDVASRKREGD